MKFYLLNTVSKRRTKMVRKAAPTPQKYVQRLCGGSIAIRRGRHFPITSEQLEQHLEELATKQAAGAIEVRKGSPMGPVVQFATLDESKIMVEAENAQPVSQKSDDASKGVASDEVESSEGGQEDLEEEAEPDFASMTNAALIKVILDHSDDWPEKDLKKLKKADLLELLT